MSMIEFRSVCKEYHGRRAIDTLSLKIEAKARVVLFGPSGCGKSTVLHLIAGLVIPDAGNILVFASHSNAGSAWSFRTSRSGLT